MTTTCTPAGTIPAGLHPDHPLCPTHLVPAVRQLAYRENGDPFFQFGCLMCTTDLGLPADELFIVGTTTPALVAARREREGAAA